MKIVLVSFEFPPVTATGGIGSYMYHLATCLTYNGHQVTVFSACPGATAVRIVEYSYCTNYLVPAVSNDEFRAQVLPVFSTFFKNNKVDVMESPEVGACALSIKETYPSIPLIVKMHTPGVLITKVSSMYVPLIKKLRFVAGALLRGKIDMGCWATYDKNRDADVEYQICMAADILLSPSKALKNWATNFWGIDAERIAVLANPFSLDEALFNLPLHNRQKIICFIGKLSVLKGMKALTKAIPMILEKNKEYRIFLVGRDDLDNGQSMKAYMQQELSSYTSRIMFTGALEKEALTEVYANSRVCLCTSLWENYPTVVLEAMAAGAVVAASAVGGIPEMIDDRVNGFLFDGKDPNQIAKVVNSILSEDAQRLAIADAARMHLKDRISDKAYERKLLEIYSQYGAAC